MTEDTIFQQQLDTIEELARINEEEAVPMKEMLPLLSFLCLIVIEDWRNYIIADKAVFMLIWSPLLWLLPALLMEI